MGSPPRRRGGPHRAQQRRYLNGLTPAQAGRTRSRGRRPGLQRAHPRAGGADPINLTSETLDGGSPPRRRGGLIGGVVWVSMLGLTPAQAGRTGRSRSAKSRAWAHPRAGGADLVSASMVASADGSPPRRRGGRPRSSSCVSPPAAHPRAGGADLYLRRLSILTEGSPPRRRGGPGPLAQILGAPRLTPAQAGRTNDSVNVSPLLRAHPRAGGADFSMDPGEVAGKGSPPRRRGGPGLVGQAGDGRGLTPAQAGRTLRARGGRRGMVAHPRAGGADGVRLPDVAPRPGSPPRRRGGRRNRPAPVRADGLTPAQAGRTSSVCAWISGARAHPRAGGADPSGTTGVDVNVGSPPRRRGGPNTTASGAAGARAHPRAGGADAALEVGPAWTTGSPPRRRGGRRRSTRRLRGSGLTPAQAGRTNPPPKGTPS